jgi:cytochrome c oxidase subunit 1
VHNFETMPVVVCGPYEYSIGVDQMGRGLPERPGGFMNPDDTDATVSANEES